MSGYRYQLDKDVFSPDGSPLPGARARWEQLTAAAVIRSIATGERPDAELVHRIESKRIWYGGAYDEQNLTALGTAGAALFGAIPGEQLAKMWKYGRLNGPGHFQGKSLGYANYDTVAKLAGLEVGGEAAEEAVRGLRREIAWWCLGAAPDGNVYLPCGRVYWHEGGEPYVPEHLQPIMAAVLGLPVLIKPGDKRWAWTGMYSAQPFAVEAGRLVPALFTDAERSALHSWHQNRQVRPGLEALLSELRAPEGARWEIRAWADGSHAGVVSGLRPYISGHNGMISAVSCRRGSVPWTGWTDGYADGRFVSGHALVEPSGGHASEGRVTADGEPAAIVVLDHDGVTVNGRRIVPTRNLPQLEPWVPSRPGLAGVQGGTVHAEPEAPTRERPEGEPTAPSPSPDLEMLELRELGQRVRDTEYLPLWVNRFAHRALATLDKLGAW